MNHTDNQANEAILAAVAQAQPAGMTVHEIQQAAGLQFFDTWQRVRNLIERGKLRRGVERSGRIAYVLGPVYLPAGAR